MPARRLSEEQKHLQNTWKATRAVSRTEYEGGNIKLPSWMSRGAKKEAKRVLKWLEQQGAEYITALDTAALVSYATNYDAWQLAEEYLLKNGSIEQQPIVNKASGNIVGYKSAPSPYLAIARSRSIAMLKSAQQLALNPLSRESISVKPTKKKTTLKKWEQKTYNVNDALNTDADLIKEYNA